MTTTPVERFWGHVVPSPTSGCLLWFGSKNPKGYGQFSLNGRMMPAHRFSWESKHGPIPEGLQFDHLCRVRACVNPNHLEPVTLAENVRRGIAARTHCRHGHPRTPENLRARRNGRVVCLPCVRRHASDSYRRTKARLTKAVPR